MRGGLDVAWKLKEEEKKKRDPARHGRLINTMTPWQHRFRNLFSLLSLYSPSSSSSPRSSTGGSHSHPQYRYDRLEDDVDDDDDDENMAGPDEAAGVVVSESSRPGVDAAVAKRILRKIDMRLIPLLFVTYMLNFMDKTILSSASVFGLQDDTVRPTCATLNVHLGTIY